MFFKFTRAFITSSENKVGLDEISDNPRTCLLNINEAGFSDLSKELGFDINKHRITPAENAKIINYYLVEGVDSMLNEIVISKTVTGIQAGYVRAYFNPDEDARMNMSLMSRAIRCLRTRNIKSYTIILFQLIALKVFLI